jgi:hypothetical protein
VDLEIEFQMQADSQNLSFQQASKNFQSNVDFGTEKTVASVAVVSVELAVGNKLGSWSYNSQEETLYYKSNQKKIVGLIALKKDNPNRGIILS